MALVVFTGRCSQRQVVAAQALARAQAAGRRSPSRGRSSPRRVDDPEMAERIARHQADRPAEFAVVEAPDSRSVARPGRPSDRCCWSTASARLSGMVMTEEWPSDAAGRELVDAGTRSPAGFAESRRGASRRAGSTPSAIDAGTRSSSPTRSATGVVPAFASGPPLPRRARPSQPRARRAGPTLPTSPSAGGLST